MSLCNSICCNFKSSNFCILRYSLHSATFLSLYLFCHPWSLCYVERLLIKSWNEIFSFVFCVEQIKTEVKAVVTPSSWYFRRTSRKDCQKEHGEKYVYINHNFTNMYKIVGPLIHSFITFWTISAYLFYFHLSVITENKLTAWSKIRLFKLSKPIVVEMCTVYISHPLQISALRIRLFLLYL